MQEEKKMLNILQEFFYLASNFFVQKYSVLLKTDPQIKS